jgi:hypothetical protein
MPTNMQTTDQCCSNTNIVQQYPQQYQQQTQPMNTNQNYYDKNYMNPNTNTMPMSSNQNYSNVLQNSATYYEKDTVKQRGHTLK